MSQSNPKNFPSNHPNFPKQDDEIDLKELFKALWDGKLVILLCTAIFAIGALTFAWTSQEWWSAKAKIALPQPQDIAAYQQQVKQFQPVFDIYQEDGTILVSNDLDPLLSTSVLFQQFINEFNSSNNKRTFLDSSEEFQVFKNQLDVDADVDDAKGQAQRLYSEWFSKISASSESKNSQSSPYNLSFQATTKEISFTLLSEYVNVIAEKVHSDALNNLQAMIASKQDELIQQKRILESQARNKLLVEIERVKYALEIAKAAKVDTPIQTNNPELFNIDLGTKGLAAKVTALESIKNLSVIEPRLQQIDAKLSMLKELKIDRSIDFQTFRYLEDIEQPLNRDKPKRALIAVLGTLLGGMLGVAIVLVRFAFRREDESEQ